MLIRPVLAKSLFSLSTLALTALAPSTLYAADDHILDASGLQALAAKAEHASLRDQCYLYAQLVRGSTELANRSLASGDSAAGALALHAVELYTASLDTALAKDAKKLKDAEILLRESAFRLKAAMLASSLEDRPAMTAALSKINATEAKVMGAVFEH